MFKNESRQGTETIIGPSVHVEGDLSSQGDIMVAGSVTGTITTTGSLTVGEGASITANVQAANAFIAGKLKGNLAVTERLELAPTSHVSGDVVTKVLVVADGAKLDGRCQMGSAAVVTPAAKASGKRATQPVAEPAA